MYPEGSPSRFSCVLKTCFLVNQETVKFFIRNSVMIWNALIEMLSEG